MKRNTQIASVLIPVLWSCLGLVSVALLFGHSMLMSYRGAENEIAGHQAEEAIEGVARLSGTVFAAVDQVGQMPDPTAYPNEEITIGDATAWILGRAEDFDTDSHADQTFGLVDEASKLNLNTATTQMLMGLPGMTEELAAAIIDWRDADETVSPNGAESETYARCTPPYTCKNAPFESVDELSLVNGATKEILYGEDANLNGILEENEDDGDKSDPADNADGKLDPGILDFVTVFTREPNSQADGSARVNVAQPGPQLATLLTGTFGAARADQIMQRTGTASRFTSVLGFYVRSGMTADEFAKIEDAITTGTGTYIVGRVNVNTATETVLACIPGIGTEKAASLVAARTSRAQQDTSIAWVVDTLGPEGATAAGPFITSRTFQVSADVAAVGANGRGYRRTQFVIDKSTGTPRIVYRRNLAPLGWALGESIRQNLDSAKATR